MSVATYFVMRFHEKLRAALRHKRLSQGAVAQEIGVSQGLVSGWCRDTYKPDVHQAFALARILGVTLDYLANERDKRTAAQVEREMKVREIIDMIGWDEAYARIVGRDRGGAEPRLLPPPPEEGIA